MSRSDTNGHANRAYNGVFLSAVNALFVNAASFVVFVAMSRLLAPEDFGLSATAGAAVAFFAMALSTGFGEALVRRKTLDDEHKDGAFWLRYGVRRIVIKTYLLWPMSILTSMRLLGLGSVRYMQLFRAPHLASMALCSAVLAVYAGVLPPLRLSAEVPAGAAVCLGMLWLLSPGSIRSAIRSTVRVKQVRHA